MLDHAFSTGEVLAPIGQKFGGRGKCDLQWVFITMGLWSPKETDYSVSVVLKVYGRWTLGRKHLKKAGWRESMTRAEK